MNKGEKLPGSEIKHFISLIFRWFLWAKHVVVLLHYTKEEIKTQREPDKPWSYTVCHHWDQEPNPMVVKNSLFKNRNKQTKKNRTSRRRRKEQRGKKIRQHFLSSYQWNFKHNLNIYENQEKWLKGNRLRHWSYISNTFVVK